MAWLQNMIQIYVLSTNFSISITRHETGQLAYMPLDIGCSQLTQVPE